MNERKWVIGNLGGKQTIDRNNLITTTVSLSITSNKIYNIQFNNSNLN